MSKTCMRLQAISQAWKCCSSHSFEADRLFRLWAHLSGCLDDDRDGQVDIVGVDKAHCAPSVASKCGMHCVMRQDLHHQQLLHTLPKDCPFQGALQPWETSE